MTKEFRLPKENYASLLEAERNLHDALDDIIKAEACGIDCAPLRAVRDEYMERIAAIKQNYAPRSSF